MWYYSIGVIMFMVLALFADLIQGIDVGDSFWAIVIFAPIAVWLFRAGKK